MKLDDLHKLMTFEFHHTRQDQEQMRAVLRSMGIDPSCIYQEMEMSSRFVNTHRDTTYSKGSVSLHSHAFYELLYCRSGGVGYLVGSDRYRLQKGDIVFISPGVSHCPILPEQMDEPYVRDVIWIDPEFLSAISVAFPDSAGPNPQSNGPLRTAGTHWELLGELFQRGIAEEEQKRVGWELAVLGNTAMILTYLERAHIERSTGVVRAEKPELLDRITAYIEKHYADPLTVREIARNFYVSDSSISHLFKEKMGVSLYRYVTQRRLIAAKNLIQAGLPLEQVATQVGFSDYSAFYRAFKGEYGISPRQYRKL